MKRIHTLLAVLLLMLAGQALAGGIGAVKVPFEPEVGWVVLNTSGDGRLLGTIQLDAAMPDAEFDVTVRVRYEDQTVEIFADTAVLRTNGQGRGGAQFRLALSPPEGSATVRRVAVRVRPPQGPAYVAVAWDTPLKPHPFADAPRR